MDHAAGAAAVTKARAINAIRRVKDMVAALQHRDRPEAFFDLARTSDRQDIAPDVTPDQIAQVALWPGRDPPPFVGQMWETMKARLLSENQDWAVWIDWCEARLDGGDRGLRIELPYVEFIRAVSPADPTKANAEIKRLLDDVTELVAPADQNWDFFISYASEDEAFAREIVDIVEGEGHSTIAQFKDFAVGANFVNEINRGLAGASRVIALYSPNY